MTVDVVQSLSSFSNSVNISEDSRKFNQKNSIYSPEMLIMNGLTKWQGEVHGSWGSSPERCSWMYSVNIVCTKVRHLDLQNAKLYSLFSAWFFW